MYRLDWLIDHILQPHVEHYSIDLSGDFSVYFYAGHINASLPTIQSPTPRPIMSHLPIIHLNINNLPISILLPATLLNINILPVLFLLSRDLCSHLNTRDRLRQSYSWNGAEDNLTALVHNIPDRLKDCFSSTLKINS